MLSDQASHGVPDDMGGVPSLGIHQRQCVFRHSGDGQRRFECGTQSYAAIVEGEAGELTGQGIDLRFPSVPMQSGAQYENHGRALAGYSMDEQMACHPAY